MILGGRMPKKLGELFASITSVKPSVARLASMGRITGKCRKTMCETEAPVPAPARTNMRSRNSGTPARAVRGSTEMRVMVGSGVIYPEMISRAALCPEAIAPSRVAGSGDAA